VKIKPTATVPLCEHQLPSSEELEQLFVSKYGRPELTGWAPRKRFHRGYYLPADIYEALLAKCVFQGCQWIDVGGGRDIFPENPRLARSLASRCSLVTAIDPSDNVYSNTFVHRPVRCTIENYDTPQQFDLATLRMVAEHVENPEQVVQALHRLLRLEGKAIVLTVNLWSPITILSRFTPFRTHHPIKRLFWGGEERDTFPVRYRMNTRNTLRHLFEQNGFREATFAYLDDLSTFSRSRHLSSVEMLLWRLCRALGLRYPENCLLGVYVKIRP
jgi:2-polyprenyl-3-methyl-5-hydroxy-6-metoxy-1,4-benzoquinol methylase